MIKNIKKKCFKVEEEPIATSNIRTAHPPSARPVAEAASAANAQQRDPRQTTSFTNPTIEVLVEQSAEQEEHLPEYPGSE